MNARIADRLILVQDQYQRVRKIRKLTADHTRDDLGRRQLSQRQQAEHAVAEVPGNGLDGRHDTPNEGDRVAIGLRQRKPGHASGRVGGPGGQQGRLAVARRGHKERHSTADAAIQHLEQPRPSDVMRAERRLDDASSAHHRPGVQRAVLLRRSVLGQYNDTPRRLELTLERPAAACATAHATALTRPASVRCCSLTLRRRLILQAEARSVELHIRAEGSRLASSVSTSAVLKVGAPDLTALIPP